MTRLALAFVLLTGCGTPFALRVAKPPTAADSTAARCRSRMVQRTAWTVASAMLGATSAGAAPITATLTDPIAREGVTIGGVAAGALSAVAAALATIDGVQFEQSCALRVGAP